MEKICPLIPEDEQCVIKGKIILEKDVFIGANAMIFPNVQIGEGAIIGSASLVTKDVEPWTVNVGTQAKVIGIRPKVEKGSSPI